MQDLVAPQHDGSGRHADLHDVLGLEPLLPRCALLRSPQMRALKVHALFSDAASRRHGGVWTHRHDQRHAVPGHVVGDVPADLELDHRQQAVVRRPEPFLLV